VLLLLPLHALQQLSEGTTVPADSMDPVLPWPRALKLQPPAILSMGTSVPPKSLSTMTTLWPSRLLCSVHLAT
jgi:hypothetical protein